jgi:hypothetical protein
LRGLFAVADSAITSPDGKTLLSGFRKVYPVPIKLWKPTFIQESFKTYQNVYWETEAFLAFAGSTLTAQHYMNAVDEHLANLRITCFPNDGPIRYRVGLLCESKDNPLFKPNTYWGEDTFVDRDFDGLLTDEVIVDTVQHSLEAAVRSARGYKLDEREFHSLLTHFAFGFRSPEAGGEYRLYQFDMETEQDPEGLMQVRVRRKSVSPGQVAVLGMRGEFGSRAQSAYERALSSRQPVEAAIFEFVQSAVREVKSASGTGIDMPVVWWRLDDHPRVRLIEKAVSDKPEPL